MNLLPRPVDLVNASISTRGIHIQRNIAYGPAARDQIDIYRPSAPKTSAPLPIIVFFYGGSWQFGHRAEYRFIATLLAKRGYVVAVPDYRLYPEVKFPAFLHDSAAAIAHIISHAAEYGANPQQLFLIGHSAGAYNAAMLALDPQFLAPHGLTPACLSGVVGLSGPYDFLPLRDPVIKDIFSPPADITLTQPITHANAATSAGSPPMLLLHGGADITVLPRNSTALAARINAIGGTAQVKIYPRLGHIGMILSLLPYLSWRTPVGRDIFSFMANYAGHLAGYGQPAPMVT